MDGETEYGSSWISIESGVAVFMPREHTMRQLRIHTRDMLFVATEPEPFEVVKTEKCYLPVMLDRALSSEGRVAQLLEGIEDSDDGVLLCAALIDVHGGTGVLLCRRYGEVLCACLPLMTREQALKERTLALRLQLLASETRGRKVYMRRMNEGSYDMSFILGLLADQLDG